MSDDPLMAEVMAAVAQWQAGATGARAALLRLWKAEPIDAPVRRCTVAHFLADIEADANAELGWDRAALEAATGSADGDENARVEQLVGFLPSLHLNLGDAFRRTGDLERARFHAQAGVRRAVALSDDGYGATVRTALDRLLARIDQSAGADERGH